MGDNQKASPLKVLNLYCGIGGNRLLWGDNIEVTAVDYNPDVLECYTHHNPRDAVVLGDAHQYLLDHYDEYDFIWASPPCPTHSRMMKATRHDVRKYPDMTLYQEIIWLQHFFQGDWIVENVAPYYTPLIAPQMIGRHAFWSNKVLHAQDVPSPSGFITMSGAAQVKELQEWLGIRWDNSIYIGDNNCPGQVYRNDVHPRLGRDVFYSAIRKEGLFA